MNSNTISGIISLILGLIIIICPLTGYLAANIFLAVSIAMVGILALVIGLIGDKSTLNIILGIIFIILGVLVFFNPAFLSALTAFVNYFAGIVLFIFAIVNLITRDESILLSVSAIFMAIICIIFGFLSYNPVILGVMIGVWFILAGIIKITTPTEIV